MTHPPAHPSAHPSAHPLAHPATPGPRRVPQTGAVTDAVTGAVTDAVTGAMTDAVIDAVIFDLGNVLVGWDPRRAFAGELDDGAIDEFFAAVDFPALNHELDAGLPVAAARARVAAEHPEHVATLDRYVERFAATLTGPVPGSAAVVAELRAAGLRLVGLTNWSAETFHHAQPAAPAIGLLDAVVVSGREGLAKPDPRLFRRTVARFGLDPARTLFVDDAPRNVEAAAGVGLRTHRFTSAPRLRAALADLGVAVGPRLGDADGDADGGGDRGSDAGDR